MGNNGVRCGNCGALNGVTEQFCVSCGVLLAAYQSPSGAQPPAEESPAAEPAPPRPSPAEASTAAPSVAAPEPGDAIGEKPRVAHSVDEIFGSRPDVDELAATRASAPTASIPPESMPTVRDDEPPAPKREEVDEAPPVRSSRDATVATRLQDVATLPVEVNRPSIGAQARTASRTALPGWSQSDRGRAALGTGGRRVDTTPPQTLIVIGGLLILAACVLGPTATVVDLPLLIAGPLWCAFPMGVFLLVIGVIRLASRRPNRF